MVLEGGRDRNFALGKDGTFIPLTNIDIPNTTEHVRQFQFIQDRKGSMSLRIIRKDGFGSSDMQRIRQKLDEKFSENMDITIEFTDTIKQGGNNKTQLFVQKIQDIAEYKPVSNA